MPSSFNTNKVNETNHLRRAEPGNAGRIDDSDKVAAFEAAHYRCTSRMRELEQQFEVKASETRAAFVAEVAEISGAVD